MKKEKVLEIEYQEVFDKVAVKIKNINNDFFADGFYKEDVEKYNCSREESPYNSEECVLFLGDDIIISDKSIYCYTQEKIKEIKEFVDFVNEKYGIPKRWRAKELEEYYYIGSNGIVWSVGEEFSDEDNDHYNLGNYFQTKEEAQKVVDSKEWQDFWAKVRAREIGEENNDKS